MDTFRSGLTVDKLMQWNQHNSDRISQPTK